MTFKKSSYNHVIRYNNNPFPLKLIVVEIFANDRLWSIFLRRLKTEVVEEWYLAKLEGSLTLFESRTLVAGLLGRLVNGCVEWNAELSEVTYDYFNLFN